MSVTTGECGQRWRGREGRCPWESDKVSRRGWHLECALRDEKHVANLGEAFYAELREQHMQRPWGRNKCGVSEAQKGARLVFGEHRGRPQRGGRG